MRFQKLRFHMVALLLLMATMLWAATLDTFSIRNAVPAAREHIDNASPEAPDTSQENVRTVNYVSVSFMTRGYCYAASQLKDDEALGGFGTSDNTARPVRSGSTGKGLFLLAQPGVSRSFADGPGMRVVLVNRTNLLLALRASDSRLDIVQEAQDKGGVWQPIEYLPSSWCGNSHHRVFLAPNYFWEFAAPRYKGTIATKLRFSLSLADGSKLLSNEFDGSVNPEQFTVKQGHTATNIMDSYSE